MKYVVVALKLNTGPRGGKYYVNNNGNKTYVSKMEEKILSHFDKKIDKRVAEHLTKLTPKEQDKVVDKSTSLLSKFKDKVKGGTDALKGFSKKQIEAAKGLSKRVTDKFKKTDEGKKEVEKNGEEAIDNKATILVLATASALFQGDIHLSDADKEDTDSEDDTEESSSDKKSSGKFYHSGK
jgi:hypothetical protein